ncbi:MAG: DUF2452 domain-containing protein [Bacteroidia bacterium]|nr:DUF2452 domain-containing protein [Bacteroidia bacterium]
MHDNPIDKDKTAENPGLLPYAHSVGGALIRPEDKGKIKGQAMMAMEQQTARQMEQLRKQYEVLAAQAQEIKRRVEISERIYQADVGFQPIIGHIYHLYERKNGSWALSMVAPAEWGRSMPFTDHLGTVRLLADHTWELLELTPPA